MGGGEHPEPGTGAVGQCGDAGIGRHFPIDIGEQDVSDDVFAEWSGHCPICRSATTFKAWTSWFRDGLICVNCPGYSVPRERALMLLLDRLRPNWRDLSIHESSPAPRGVSARLHADCPNYTASHFFPDVAPGHFKNETRCENIEAMTFPDQSFDIVITQDVMEHVFHPDRAYGETYRVLRPGGLHLHTTPISMVMPESIRAAELGADGEIRHLMPAQYHGNPISDQGSLVTFHYGRDIVSLIAGWTPFSVEMVAFNDRFHGVVGEFTEVIACFRPPTTLG
jgi:hypothetical protein